MEVSDSFAFSWDPFPPIGLCSSTQLKLFKWSQQQQQHSLLPDPMFWVPKWKSYTNTLYIFICLKQLNGCIPLTSKWRLWSLLCTSQTWHPGSPSLDIANLLPPFSFLLPYFLLLPFSSLLSPLSSLLPPSSFLLPSSLLPPPAFLLPPLSSLFPPLSFLLPHLFLLHITHHHYCSLL